MQTSKILSLATAVTLGVPFVSTPVAASEPTTPTESVGAIQEVIVTATRREESVYEVPISIAVLGGAEIERRGAIGMEDYLRSVPGVSQIDNGPRSNAIVIRGISTSPENENASSGTTVATYFGETPITGGGGYGAGGIDVRPVDIERVEILRGPQGTTYGSASLGGAVRIIPNRPRLDAFGGNVTGSYSGTSGRGGSNSMVQGTLNIPVVEDKFALRAVGYRFDESGFYENNAGTNPALLAWADNYNLGDYLQGYHASDVGAVLTTGGRLSALWQATDDLKVTLVYLTQDIEQDGSPFANSGRFQQAMMPLTPSGMLRGTRTDVNDTDMDLVNLVTEYGAGWADFTGSLSWVNAGAQYANGVGLNSSYGPSSSWGISDFKSFTFEGRLASRLDGPLQFLAGVYYEDVKEDYLQHSGIWPGDPADIPWVTDPEFTSSRTRDLQQSALFGEISYDIVERLTATVGGRYFKYEKDHTVMYEGGLNGLTPSREPLIPIGGGTRQYLSSKESDTSFKASLKYQLAPDSIVYASWAEGFRLGRPDIGLTTLASVCDTDGDGFVDGTSVSIEGTRNIDSDFLESYEIGAKGMLFDRRLNVDVAVYRIDWSGLPVRAYGQCGTQRPSYTDNAGSAISEGMEVQGMWLVADGVQLSFGGSYINARLAEDAPGLNARRGDRLPGAPKMNANLGLQYEFELSGYRSFVRADSFYVGEFYGDLAESPNTRAGNYVKLDARAGIKFDRVSVELFARNLTNKYAYTWRGLSNGNVDFGYLMRPRTVGLQVGYSFE